MSTTINLDVDRNLDPYEDSQYSGDVQKEGMKLASQGIHPDNIEAERLASEDEHSPNLAEFLDFYGHLSISDDVRMDEPSQNEGLDWSRITRIALTPFPARELDEDVSLVEIKTRLGELRDAGYKVRKFDRMRYGTAKDYLKHVINGIRHRASYKCPDTLDKMVEANKRAREEDLFTR